MLVVNGIFKNNVFVPDQIVSVQDGTKATVSIREPAPMENPDSTQQKRAWHDFFSGIKSTDEKLPAEFDKIIEKGIVFNQADFL